MKTKELRLRALQEQAAAATQEADALDQAFLAFLYSMVAEEISRQLKMAAADQIVSDLNAEL